MSNSDLKIRAVSALSASSAPPASSVDQLSAPTFTPMPTALHAALRRLAEAGTLTSAETADAFAVIMRG